MKLKYPVKSSAVEEIIERMKDLSLQFSPLLDSELSSPVLINGKSRYQGLSEITAFIDQLDNEKKMWYYCAC